MLSIDLNFTPIPQKTLHYFLSMYLHENNKVGIKILIAFPFTIIYGYFYYFQLKYFIFGKKNRSPFCWTLRAFCQIFYNVEESNHKLSKNKTRRLSLAQRNLCQPMDFPKQPHVFHRACSYSRRKQIETETHCKIVLTLVLGLQYSLPSFS